MRWNADAVWAKWENAKWKICSEYWIIAENEKSVKHKLFNALKQSQNIAHFKRKKNPKAWGR